MSGAMKSTKKTCRPSWKNISSCTAIFEFDEIEIVNNRSDTEVETEFVRFDRLRVLCVLERIAADLDDFSRLPNDAHADKEPNPRDARARHRHELAEPPRELNKLSHQEQRRALRAALGLPPL